MHPLIFLCLSWFGLWLYPLSWGFFFFRLLSPQKHSKAPFKFLLLWRTQKNCNESWSANTWTTQTGLSNLSFTFLQKSVYPSHAIFLFIANKILKYFTQLTLYLRGLGGADSYPGCLTLGCNPLQFELRSQTDEIIRRHQSKFILKISNSQIWDSLSEHLLTMPWNVSLLFFPLDVANTITDSVQPKQSHMPTIRASYTQISSQLTTVWSQKKKQPVWLFQSMSCSEFYHKAFSGSDN